MNHRSHSPVAARAARAVVFISAVAACDVLLANTGVQLPLSQYQAGAEQTTLVPNGNFSNPGTEDSPGSGTFSNPPSWENRTGDITVRAPVFSDPSYSSQINPYSAVVPNTSASNSWTQSISGLTPNGNYLISAYVWNAGRYDTSGNGQGDTANIKVQDPNNTNSNISLTLEAQAADGGSAATGRFMYLPLNEAQVRAWSSVQLYVDADTGTIAGTLPANWAQFDNVAITPSDQFVAQKWTSTGGGNYLDSANWLSGLVPTGVGAVATLPSAGAQTVNLDSPVTVAIFKMQGGTYTINGNPLTLDVPADGFGNLQGLPELIVQGGAQVINVPVNMQHSGILNVAAGSSVNLAGGLKMADPANNDLLKIGGGTATVSIGLGAHYVTISAGTMQLAPDGGPSGVMHVTSLSIAPGAKLDLTNNHLITGDPVGTWNGTSYDGVTGLVASGRGTGTWNGTTGITTSSATGTLTGLGVASASDVKGIAADGTATWAGQTVQGSDTLVMFTYGGDANLDGVINIDDYGRIDSNVGIAGASGWYNGDFNYDGKINIDDYGIIDSNVGVQGPPMFAGSGVTGVAAVPEPASIGLAAAALSLGAMRRRRDRR